MPFKSNIDSYETLDQVLSLRRYVAINLFQAPPFEHNPPGMNTCTQCRYYSLFISLTMRILLATVLLLLQSFTWAAPTPRATAPRDTTSPSSTLCTSSQCPAISTDFTSLTIGSLLLICTVNYEFLSGTYAITD